MGLGLMQPGCSCCSCLGWTGTPPEELQVTLPVGCTLSGTHVLSLLSPGVVGHDCISSVNFPIDTCCNLWGLSFPAEDDCVDPTHIVVCVGDWDGKAVVMVGVCGDCPGGIGTINSGTLWTLYPPVIKDYADLDGLSVPFDLTGGGDCTDCPKTDCTTSDDALIEIPP